MIEPGNQVKKHRIDLNAELLKLQGHLEDKEARLSLVKFLRHNIGLTVELISGIRLFPFQELILRTWFEKNYNLAVVGRGGSKSWLAAMFCVLYSIFYPETRIIIVAQNFRTSRRIFEQIQKFVKHKNALLLRQCFSNEETRRNDSWNWEVNGGVITCLPLASGDKIRGTRADVLIVDEFLLIPEDIYKSVLMPFLVAKANVKQQLEIKEYEDRLIAAGKLKEEDRTVLNSGKKILALSSASFSFEYLYRLYQEWIDKIINPKPGVRSTYSVCQLSYEALPAELIDASVIEEAQSGGMSNAVFLREYCGRFTDDSDSYFSAKKMMECTAPDGHYPTIELQGDPKAEYALAIDPSFSSSKASDDFAMNVVKLNKESKTGLLVHNYAVAGGDLKDHIAYLHYLLTHFNIVYIIIDKGGGESFVGACNESALFKGSALKLEFFDAQFDDDLEYAKGVRASKLSYKPTIRKFCHNQLFSPTTIRRMNEHLQACIDHKKVWFASHATSHEGEYKRLLSLQLPIVGDAQKGDYQLKLSDFIDEQGTLIDLTKKECSLIEVKSSAGTGVQSFDLPSHLRKSTNKDRARKDSYTCLMLANWAAKCYFDMMDAPAVYSGGFMPIALG